MRKTEPGWMGVATGLLGGQLTNRSSIPGKGQWSVCSAVSRPAVGPTLLLVRGYWGAVESWSWQLTCI